MAVTQNSYVGNGSTTTYSFTFPYLKASDVKAQLDADVTTAFTLPTATTLQFNTAPDNGAKIKIYRETSDDALTATFYAGSSVKSEDLNDNFTQNLYSTQEISARYLSNLGGTMVGDLTMGEDAEIIFEGATDDAYETKLTVADPTADRTITLPNVTGTVVTTGDTASVTSTMIVDGTIVNADIADTTITGGKLVNDTITATQIAANAVTARELADNAVDQNAIAADAINGSKIQDDSIDSEHYVDGSIDTAHYAANSVDTTALAADAVTGAQLADNAVNSEHITNGSVDLAHLSADSVDSSKIVAGSIVNSDINASAAIAGSKLADDSVTATQLAADSVGASELADNSVASANIIDDSIVNADVKSDAAISQGKLALDSALTTLGGMPGGTATILADSTALTSTTAELNILDGKSFVTSVSGSSTDVQIPSAKAVNDQVVALVQDIGGFYPIDDKAKFPNTNPDPNDDAGTIVSIADAGGIVVNGSGVSTSAETLGGTTVTINGIDSTLNNTTIAAGKGMLVQTTSTLNTYTYHRLVVDEAGVASAQTLVTDFNQRYQVAGSEPSNQPDGTDLAEGDLFFNTGTDKMMVYDGSNYAEVTSVGDYKLLTLVDAGQTSGLTLGSATEFDLRDGSSAASVTSAGQLIISVNGVLQKPNSGTSQPSEGFCLKDSNTIQFGAAPANGSSIFVTLIGSATTVNVPADNSVTEAKLNVSNSPADDKYLKTMANGTLSWADAATATLTTRGDVLYRGASADARLPAGTSGQYLQTKGSGADPVWADVVGAVANGCIYENDLDLSGAHTIAATKGAHSVGPITVGNTVTVSGRWVIS